MTEFLQTCRPERKEYIAWADQTAAAVRALSEDCEWSHGRIKELEAEVERLKQVNEHLSRGLTAIRDRAYGYHGLEFCDRTADKSLAAAEAVLKGGDA